MVTFEQFNTVYQQAVDEVFQFWTPAMQDEMARHNVGWAHSAFDFAPYLRQSVTRYYRAYERITNATSVCDVGGFWGVFPLTLHRLGFQVSMTEALQYYSASFNALFDHIRINGVTVIDYDPFQDGTQLPGSFDAVLVMAVLEHYPYSLKTFMHNMRGGLRSEGLLYLEVPNIAYWPKRVAMLHGISPLPPVEHVFHSATPFTGHHREYTMHDLERVAGLGGFRVVHRDYYNYSVQRTTLGHWLRQPLTTWAFAFYPATREILAITCEVGQ